MQHLIIDRSSIIYTVVEGFSGYELLFEWGDSFPSCALTYSVNFTYENNTRTTFNTIHTNYLSSSHTRGSKFNVSVAGVNGNVTGPYTPEICFEIEGKKALILKTRFDHVTPVPGYVNVTSKNITKEGFGYFLEIIWEVTDLYYLSKSSSLIFVQPPVTSCRRPSVERYIINYDFQSYESGNTGFSTTLHSTIDRKANLSVTIIAVNVIGQGISTTISVPFPNSAITGKMTCKIIIITVLS